MDQMSLAEVINEELIDALLPWSENIPAYVKNPSETINQVSDGLFIQNVYHLYLEFITPPSLYIVGGNADFLIISNLSQSALPLLKPLCH